MSYIIFSIDRWYDLHTLAKFTRHIDTIRAMGNLQGDVIPVIGCYEDKPEISFICTDHDFHKHVVPSGYLAEQKTYLEVTEEKQMPAWIKDFLGNTLDKGRLTQKSHALALSESDGWTYRPDIDKFFVME
jgi:hypothetical protein